MKTQPAHKPAAVPKQSLPPDEVLPNLFALLFGLLLGLGLLKFGNPIVMEKFVSRPENQVEWVLNPWPVHLAWGLLACVTVVGILASRWRKDLPWGLLVLPLVWLGWQFVASIGSIDARLSAATLKHFVSCVVCFYLGVFALGRNRNLFLFSLGLIGGFALVLVSGFQQHFGGLEATRRYFFLYFYPRLEELDKLPPGYLKKMSSNRIWATLFYPNALAGVILMMLPIALGIIWSARERFTAGARGLLAGMVATASLACLYWSGSKGGWLLMLLTGLVGSLFLPFKRQLKIVLIVGVLVLGLAGFGLKYAGFFKRGATSVVARFDYWRAALHTVAVHPVFGTGPGTFGAAYEKVRKPESEPAKITHNDYLEQASDSGVVGFLAYVGLVAGSLVFAYRKGGLGSDWVKLGVWLGVLGWALQSLVEFGLYIPAIAWLAFCLLGWLLAQASVTGNSNPSGSTRVA